jgi:hypothetical protein
MAWITELEIIEAPDGEQILVYRNMDTSVPLGHQMTNWKPAPIKKADQAYIDHLKELQQAN